VAVAHRQCFIDDVLDRQRLAAAHLLISRDDGNGTCINDPFLQ
jgi:hypothetical protein